MGAKFKRKESVQKGVKRLGRRRVEKALDTLAQAGRLETVHDVRRDIKQLRALLRLVRAAMSPREYRRVSGMLRKAADQLAAARDAQVKLAALENLIGHFQNEVDSFRSIKGFLAADSRRHRSGLTRSRAPANVRRLLKKLSQQFGSLKLKGSGWAAIGSGIKSSYGAGRRGYQLAREAATPEHFHEWRKRVKDLYYQMGLLCPIWPEQMNAAEAELKQLGELLGDDHDLFLLTEPEASKRFRKLAWEEAEALQALAEERQRELRARALALGARFYEEQPSAFCARLGQYWKRWRREPKQMRLNHG